MAKLGDIVTFVTDQGQPRMAFVSAEVVEPVQETDEERQAAQQAQTDLEAQQAVELKQREDQLAVLAEEAQVAHAEAEAVAGSPIQLVASVPLTPPLPLSALPSVEPTSEQKEQEQPTGPALTLHVLLHANDNDFTTGGSVAIFAGVPHSDKGLPHTWH
jgi:hypothetical protein